MKYLFYRILSLFFLILLIPIFIMLYIVIKTTSEGPFIFIQLRAGKNKRPFTMYKIRTMVEGAEKNQNIYKKLNEADGPIFKIRNDPRYTKIGKFLAHTGLDELPQLINVIKGEMSFVGPRPLPINEANKIPKKYKKRFTALPGMTSSWVVNGSHKLTFEEWMKLDVEYTKNNSISLDFSIFIKTILIISKIRKTISG